MEQVCHHDTIENAMTMKCLRKLNIITTLLSAGALAVALSVSAMAADVPAEVTLFKNVNVFDGKSDKLLMGHDVLVLVSGDMVDVAARAVPKAKAVLLRGFTTVRDMGGPAESLKKLIDTGVIPGPRILPSGPPISQTSGHFDYRDYQAIPEGSADPLSYWYRTRLLALADGVPEMLKRVRENLRFGASQIKLSTGGGVSSVYDPLDVAEFTVEEIKAAVDAAADFNTYVAVHVMTDRAIRKSIEAGVKSIEHGYFASDATLKLMAKMGVWLDPQPFF
jgi:imidazolonepropionase-like amidohydrolase